MLEPACWRTYPGEDGKPATLKPDLYVVTANGQYEDLWFLEIDLDTESPAVVLEKCRRYTHYYRSGEEKNLSGDVFPLVVWIVPSEKRKESLMHQIAGCDGLIKGLFLVILPDELEKLLRYGAAALTNTKGDA